MKPLFEEEGSLLWNDETGFMNGRKKDQFRSFMRRDGVLMVPYSVLDGPIVLNIHIGPIPA